MLVLSRVAVNFFTILEQILPETFTVRAPAFTGLVLPTHQLARSARRARRAHRARHARSAYAKVEKPGCR